MIEKIMNYFGYISKTKFNIIQNEHLNRIEYLSKKLQLSDEKITKIKSCCIENDKLNQIIVKLEAKILYLKQNKKLLGMGDNITSMQLSMILNDIKKNKDKVI